MPKGTSSRGKTFPPPVVATSVFTSDAGSATSGAAAAWAGVPIVRTVAVTRAATAAMTDARRRVYAPPVRDAGRELAVTHCPFRRDRDKPDPDISEVDRVVRHRR